MTWSEIVNYVDGPTAMALQLRQLDIESQQLAVVDELNRLVEETAGQRRLLQQFEGQSSAKQPK